MILLSKAYFKLTIAKLITSPKLIVTTIYSSLVRYLKKKIPFKSASSFCTVACYIR